MGFTFSGMMRGLGTGLVSTGALMEKYNERKFEEEQLKAKLDREEHMQRLQMQSQKELAGMQLEATAEQGRLTREQQSEQFKMGYGLDEKRLALQEQEMKANAAERAANAKFRSDQAARETEIYNMKLQEIKDKDKAILETSKALYPDDPMKQKVWTNMQKGYIQVTGKDKIGSEAVSKAIDTASILVEKIQDDDVAKEAESLGISTKGKSVSSLRSSMTAIMANQIAETASGSSGSQLGVLGQLGNKTTEAPTPTMNFKELRTQALAGNSNAISQIKALASSPKYKNNEAIQSTLRELEDKYRQDSSDTEPSFFNVGNYSE